MAVIRSLPVLAGVSLLVLAGTTAAQDLPEPVRLTFLHVNDIDDIDNFAELQTLMRQARADHAHTVTTVGGDFISPSVLSALDQGANIIAMLNAVGVDVAVFGNHEFDFGPEVATARLAESAFPWLGTNVLDAATGEPFGGSVATITQEVGAYTIGYFGLLTPDTVDLSSPDGAVVFTDVVETAEAAVASLRAGGADVVVALTHLPFAQERALARTVDGIDVMLTGHDHILVSLVEAETFILQAGEDGEYLGSLTIEIATEETRDGPEVTVVPVAWSTVTTAGVEPDPAVQALTEEYEAFLSAELGQVVGTTDIELVSLRASVRTEETSFGNLVADAMRAGVDADLAITNGGGIRGDRTYPAATELTRGDIMAELPFGNVTVLLELTGAQVIEALENGVSQVEDGAGRFPQVSGLTFTYDPAATPGSRVVEVLVDGAPIDPAATYRVATNDYMAGGGDGYAVLGQGRPIIDAAAAQYMATMVMDYVAAAGTVAPVVEGRIQTASP